MQQYLAAGLVDEIGVSVAPVLLGGGTRLLDGLPQMQLELVEAVEAPGRRAPALPREALGPAATLSTRADVAELVDAHGSGPCGLRLVEVQVLSSALTRKPASPVRARASLTAMSRINPTLRGFLIIAAIAAVIVVLHQEATLAALFMVARIAFLLAIAFFLYLLWRDHQSEIATWPAARSGSSTARRR